MLFKPPSREMIPAPPDIPSVSFRSISSGRIFNFSLNGEAIASIPDFVDAIYGFNDCSKDRTQQTGGMRSAADPSPFPCIVSPYETRTPASLEQIIEVQS
jgi:hypothetical protein